MPEERHDGKMQMWCVGCARRILGYLRGRKVQHVEIVEVMKRMGVNVFLDLFQARYSC